VGSRAGGSVGRALAPLQRPSVVRSALEIAGGPSGNQRL
jgi:hypothetical protein